MQHDLISINFVMDQGIKGTQVPPRDSQHTASLDDIVVKISINHLRRTSTNSTFTTDSFTRSSARVEVFP